MLRLTARSRRFAALAGSVLTVTAFAMLPATGWSSGTVHAGPQDARVTPAMLWAEDTKTALPFADDPFARKLPESRQPPHSTQRAGAIDQTVARVRAIATGEEPLALIDDGSVRIVTVGDTVRSSRITSITPDGLSLSDGSRLRLDADRR